MKTKNLLSLLAVAAGTFALPALSFGQIFNFTATAASSPGGLAVSAAVAVDFSVAGQVTVTVANNSPTIPSQITQFYLLRPTYVAGGDQVEVTSFSSTSIIPAGNFTPPWNYENALDSQFNNFGMDKTDYFGASYAPPPSNRLDVGDVGQFTFTLDSMAALDLDAWVASESPRVFVRWQSIGPNGDSAKGFDNVIPEPRLIGALAVLGLGGVLYARRRLTSKK